MLFKSEIKLQTTPNSYKEFTVSSGSKGIQLREFESWEKEKKFAGALLWDWDDTLAYYIYDHSNASWIVKFFEKELIQEILEAAYQKKYFISIVTSRTFVNPNDTCNHPESVTYGLSQLDPKKRIMQIYYSSDKLSIARYIAEKYKIPVAKTIFVDNEIEFLKPIAAAGMNPVLASSDKLHIRFLMKYFDIGLIPFRGICL